MVSWGMVYCCFTHIKWFSLLAVSLTVTENCFSLTNQVVEGVNEQVWRSGSTTLTTATQPQGKVGKHDSEWEYLHVCSKFISMIFNDYIKPLVNYKVPNLTLAF